MYVPGVVRGRELCLRGGYRECRNRSKKSTGVSVIEQKEIRQEPRKQPERHINIVVIFSGGSDRTTNGRSQYRSKTEPGIVAIWQEEDYLGAGMALAGDIGEGKGH